MRVANKKINNSGNTDVTSYEMLCSILAYKFDNLSKQLKLITQFVLDHPVDSALDTAAEIAAKLGVQPSSLVRFSAAIGFDGFS